MYIQISVDCILQKYIGSLDSTLFNPVTQELPRCVLINDAKRQGTRRSRVGVRKGCHCFSIVLSLRIHIVWSSSFFIWLRSHSDPIELLLRSTRSLGVSSSFIGVCTALPQPFQCIVSQITKTVVQQQMMQYSQTRLWMNM